MKNTKRILAIIFALLLTLALCCAVFAEKSGSDSDSTDDPGDTLTVGASEPEATKNPYSIGLFVTDGEGNKINGSTGCLGSSATLFIKKDYVITAKYYSNTEIIDTDDQLILGFQCDNGHVTLDHNTLRLTASDEPYTFTVTLVDPDSEAGESTHPIAVSKYRMAFSDLIVCFIGLYLIINAIRNKGSLYSDEFIKEEKKEDFRKIMRSLGVVSGLAFIAAGVTGICFSYMPWASTARYVLDGIGVASLIAMLVVSAKMTDKEKRDKAKATALTGGHTSSAAAFEFDEDEPTLDDVLAGGNNAEDTQNNDN